VPRGQRDGSLRSYSPQLYLRDSVPDLLILRKSGSAGNRMRTSGSVARNFDHKTSEAYQLTCNKDVIFVCVHYLPHKIFEIISIKLSIKGLHQKNKLIFYDA
jgi:hypothetical protein